jgi:hypothetical protein
MRSLRRRAAAVLVGLTVVATAFEAGAQVASEPAPLSVAVAPAPGPLAVAVSPARSVPPERATHDSAPWLVGGAAALVLADAGFVTYDAMAAAGVARPRVGAGIAEAAVTAPQALVSSAAAGYLASHDAENNPWLAGFMLLPGVLDSLLVHGAFAGASLPASSGALYSASWATGFDTAFTFAAIGAATSHQVLPRAIGAMEMALTAPQIAATSYSMVKDPHDVRERAALAGWSGALFLHGLFSVALPRPERTSPPPPPPEAVPEKPRLLVPASIDVAPAQVAGGAGVSVSGRWW